MTKNQKNSRRKKLIIVFSFIGFLIFSVGSLFLIFRSDLAYTMATLKLKQGDYVMTSEIFDYSGEFEDSTSHILKTDYDRACASIDSKEYDQAVLIFMELEGYEESAENADMIYKLIADDYFSQGDFENAQMYYEKANFADGVMKTHIAWGDYLYINKNFDAAIEKWIKYAGQQDIDAKIMDAEYELIIIGAANGEDYAQVVKANNLSYDERASQVVSEMLCMPACQTKTLDASETHIVYLSTDGKVYADGSNSHGQCNVSDWQGVISLCASELNSYALLCDRTVVATGSNVFGQCEVSDWKDIVSICASDTAVFGLTKDGKVLYSGGVLKWYEGVAKWTNITNISAGKEHVVALDESGNVFAAGKNDYGQCDVSEISNISNIACGPMHTILISKDGGVSVFGVSAAFEEDIESWSDVACASSSWSHIVLQDSQGNLFASGANERNQCDVTKWEEVLTFTARANFTVGVKQDGSVLTTVEGHTLDWKVMVWK